MLNTGHKIVDRQAILTWRSGQVAILSVNGWSVNPFDPVLLEILERDYSLARVQARRRSTLPNLLRSAARAAKIGLGATDLRIEFE